MKLPDIDTATQKALTETVRGMIANVDIGTEFTNSTPEGEWVVTLLQRHHQWKEKAGDVGAWSIKVVKVTGTGWKPHKGLVVVRNDGSEVDISWREAIRQTPHKDRVRAAMRAYIEDQIFEFKSKELGGGEFFRCAISGKHEHIANGAVDHIAPLTFKELCRRFFAMESEALPFGELSVSLATHGINDRRDFFEDVELAERWCGFHRVNAELRLITKLEHKQLSKRNQ
jgi:hypothetical protein